jgi:putative spermidine/putrescine transport system ATP-binding protein
MSKPVTNLARLNEPAVHLDPTPVNERPDHLVLDLVEKRYGTSAVVNALNLTVKQGEFVALLGPSGCGKTTTLRMIGGLVPVSAGRILVQGNDITDRPPHHRDMGLVFQNYALFPHLTVERNVAFGLEMRQRPRGEIAQRVRDALAMVRLSSYGSRYPRELSGGQQQRVALARALVIRPSILLLDEPLSNLDAKLREEMRLEIRDIQRTLGLTTLFVTHDQVEALSMCDRVAVMQQGSLVQYGAPIDIYERPNRPFIAEFVGRTNKLHGLVRDHGAVAVGPHILHASETPPRGTAVTIMVRPHRIQIQPFRGGARLEHFRGNNLHGTLTRITYVGDLFQYEIDVGGTLVHVEKPTATGPQPFATGEEVQLEWAFQDTLVFEE